MNTLDIDKKIILIDSECLACDNFSQWVFKHDKKKQYYFGSLQLNTTHYPTSRQLSTIQYHYKNQTFTMSSAIVKILWGLGGTKKILALLLWLIPIFIRDLGYIVFSRYRYLLFGKKTFCKLPSKEFQRQTIDSYQIKR